MGWSVAVSVDEDTNDYGKNVLPMNFAIYQLAECKLLGLDELSPGKDWAYWEDQFSPSIGLIKTQFKLYDLDGNGTIEAKELSRLFQVLDSERWTDERVERLLMMVDKNEDGHIQFGEFIDWIFRMNGYSDPSFVVAAENWAA